jgi:uncharacterized protein Yka (UPF0111/DUF47 family)
MTATQTGDLDGLEALLAHDVALHGDGGGKVRAIAHPLYGRRRAYEHRGDRLRQLLTARIATSYIGPLHREDLHALAERLDDIIDDLRHAAELLVALRPPTIPDQLVAHARVLAGAADQVVRLVAILRAPGADHPALVSIDRLESDGDAIFRAALAWLLGGEHDDLDVIRWKDILEALEHALNGIEALGDIIEGMCFRDA